MTLTRQHFQMVADILREEVEQYNAGEDVSPIVLAYRFADKLAETNPNFQRGRFLAACGVER